MIFNSKPPSAEALATHSCSQLKCLLLSLLSKKEIANCLHTHLQSAQSDAEGGDSDHPRRVHLTRRHQRDPSHQTRRRQRDPNQEPSRPTRCHQRDPSPSRDQHQRAASRDSSQEPSRQTRRRQRDPSPSRDQHQRAASRDSSQEPSRQTRRRQRDPSPSRDQHQRAASRDSSQEPSRQTRCRQRDPSHSRNQHQRAASQHQRDSSHEPSRPTRRRQRDPSPSRDQQHHQRNHSPPRSPPLRRQKRHRTRCSSPESPSWSQHKRRRRQSVSSSSSTSSSSSSSSTDTSSSYDNSDSGSRSRSRRRRHCHKRRRRRRTRRVRWQDSAPQPSISCAPPIDHKLSNRIREGKYVNFDLLLLDPHKPPLLQSRSSAKKRDKLKRHVTDLPSWLEAWNRFVCAKIAHHPAMALELAKYQTLMGMFFAKHQPQLCIEYDKLFRQAAAQDRTLRWDTIKEDVYMWALTQRPNFRDKNHVTSRLGPEPSATKPYSDRATHTTSGKEICKRFNFSKCTRGDECSFAHVCWHQGCQGQHPGKGCPKKA